MAEVGGALELADDVLAGPFEKANNAPLYLAAAAHTLLAGDHQVTVERVMTDNARNYRSSRVFQQALADAGIRHLRTRPYRPQTNGKAERFNQTLLNEWAYDQPYLSNRQRLDALAGWLHDYNWHRLHTEVGAAPADRLPIHHVCVKDS